MAVKIFILAFLINCTLIVQSQTTDSVLGEKDYFIKAHTLAANEFNDSLLKEYIYKYPEGEYLVKAKKTIDICAWQIARYKNTKESYQNYINEFPEGAAIKLAAQKLISFNDSTDNK